MRAIIIILGLILLFSSCQSPSSFRVLTVNADKYSIIEVGYKDLPQEYNPDYIVPIYYYTYDFDNDGIPVYMREDKVSYHPLIMIRYIMVMLNNYKLSGDNIYLEQAEKVSEKLLTVSHESNGAIYFFYDYELSLHGMEEEKMTVPWYSGMTQGIALSAYARFYQITGNKKYLKTADKIFCSLLNLNQEKPWVAYVDENNFYWIEEYPLPLPANTLNGYLFAIFGIYEYYLLKHDGLSKLILNASLTTMEEYLPDFRNPGGCSFYCLKHRVESAKYHYIHIILLDRLDRIVEEDYFAIMRDLFESDY